MGLSSLNAMLLPKLPSVDLYNALSTVMVLHPALFLIKELTSQQIKSFNGPILMEFTVLTMFPTILM